MNRITVAICTWNRANLLDQTLTRMHELRIPEGIEWELLIANNNSSDHTDAVIARHGTALPIRRLHEPTQGKSYAANRVLDEVRGELLLWTDDDVRVDQGWLTAAVDAANRHPHAAAFGGPIEPWFPTPPDPDLVTAFPVLGRGMCGIDHGIEEGPLPSGKVIFGANMMFRVDRLRGIRFTTDLGPRPVTLDWGDGKQQISMGGGEEIDFLRRLRSCGEDVVWIPGMRVQHYVDPRRATVPYLAKGYLEAARLSIREEGIPEGAKLLGVPRWLLRQWAEAWLMRGVYQVLGRRVDSLCWLRKRCVYRGMVLGCRDMLRAAN